MMYFRHYLWIRVADALSTFMIYFSYFFSTLVFWGFGLCFLVLLEVKFVEDWLQSFLWKLVPFRDGILFEELDIWVTLPLLLEGWSGDFALLISLRR